MTECASPKTLLIIDDDEEVLRSLRRGLDPERWNVIGFVSWKTALTELDGGVRPDAAIIDLHLLHDFPLTGEDVIGILAKKLPNIPIVALTGHPDYQQAAQRCIRCGALQFVRKPVGIAELEDRLDQAAWIQDQHRNAIEAVRAKEKAAERMQKVLFPRLCPSVAGFEFQQSSEAASTVTGDLFDYVSYPPAQQLLVVIGDAQGHGLSAALNAHVVGGAWRALTKGDQEVPDPAALLGMINTIVFLHGAEEVLMSLLILRLDVESRELAYASAGHPPPVVFRGSETIVLGESGSLLGLAPDTLYRDERFHLADGDLLLLYSDGLTSVAFRAPDTSRAPLGTDGLVREVRSLLANGTKDLTNRLLRHLKECSGVAEFEDDCTAIGIEVVRSEREPRGVPGTYIAIRDGRVIDQDQDELELVRRLQLKQPGASVLVRQATPRLA